MKILGLSFGRKNRVSDVLVKEALFAAKKAGADVKFINTVSMNIVHCHACEYCTRMRDNGDGEIHCCFKDDYHILEEAVLEADGVIVAAPVYTVGTVGQFKNFVDRFGLAHDRAWLLEENKKRKEENRPLLDPRYFKDRYAAYISVGGAQTHNWVSLGLPTMHMFGVSTQMKTIGHVDAYDQGRTAHPLLDKNLMKKCADLGITMAQLEGKSFEEVNVWAGDQEGICPICHNPLLSTTGTIHVECPVCGTRGDVRIEGEKLIVDWYPDEDKRARNTIGGLYEHYDEIQNMIRILVPKLEENGARLEKEMEKYKHFDETIARM